MPVTWLQLGVLFSALMALPFARRVDNDFWWHLRTGELIVHSGIPRHDPFSWTAAGQPWVAHEWLSEVIIYTVQSTLGYAGNLLLFGAVSVVTLALMYALGRYAGVGTRPLVALVLLAALVIGPFVTARPQVFSWFFFAIFLSILVRDYDNEPAPIWLLPPLTALWANLHLGFFFGLLLLGCWIASLAFASLRGGGRPLRWRALVVAGCIAAACANPNGPAILWYPLRYVFDSHVANGAVNEWQRPDITSLVQVPIFIAAAAVVLALFSRGRPKPFLLLVSISAVLLSMQATRNAPLVALVMIPVCGSAVAANWQGAGRAHDSGLRVNAAIAATLIAAPLAFLVALHFAQSGNGISFVHPSEEGFPSDGAAYVRAHLQDRRLFNDYNTGGYLIYKLYPVLPVFMDGRTDFYGNELLADYLRIHRAQPGWEGLLDRYGVEAVLIEKWIPLATALTASPECTSVFVGKTDVVFVRRSTSPH